MASRVVVTGAASGIGREVCCEVARRGGSVWGTYWGAADDARAFEDELARLGGTATMADVDVRDWDAVLGFGDRAARAMGGIDLWVNCAARLLAKPFEHTDAADWDDLLSSNLLGYVRGSRAAVDHLGPGGSIVNVSSITAQQPPGNLSAYVTAKGGVDALTRVLAVELADRGIRVNAVAPGAIDTPLNASSWSAEVRQKYVNGAAMHRLGQPEEIARTILMLASDDASFVTGQVLVADGGLLVNGTVGHQAE